MELRTNADRLVMQAVTGIIQHPTMRAVPMRTDRDGQVHILPATGSITYNVRIGDSVFGLAGDHVEPGVTIKNDRSEGENAALNVLSCVGNDATVLTGDAKGARGFVTGTHGGVEHVLLYFPREDLEKMAIGDRIQVRACGQGLQLLDYPGVQVMNCDPRLLTALGLREVDGKLQAPVTAVVPAHLMGSGLGSVTAARGDYDIMTGDREELRRRGLDELRFGDIVLLENCDTTYGRGYLTGAQTLGVVVHSDCIILGHGPGVTTLMSCKMPIFEPIRSREANLARLLGVE